MLPQTPKRLGNEQRGKKNSGTRAPTKKVRQSTRGIVVVSIGIPPIPQPSYSDRATPMHAHAQRPRASHTQQAPTRPCIATCLRQPLGTTFEVERLGFRVWASSRPAHSDAHPAVRYYSYLALSPSPRVFGGACVHRPVLARNKKNWSCRLGICCVYSFRERMKGPRCLFFFSFFASLNVQMDAAADGQREEWQDFKM